MKIAVIDNNSARSQSLMEILRAHGHELILARNLLELSSLANGSNPDLVVFASQLLPDTVLSLLSKQPTDKKASEQIPQSSLEELKKTIPGPEAEKMRDFRNMFVAVQTKYLRALPAKLSELNTAIEQCKRLPGEVELVDQAKMLAHKMNGTAGSLGFKQICDRMKTIEAILHAVSTGASKSIDGLGKAWQDIDSQLHLAVQTSAHLLETIPKAGDDNELVAQGASTARVLVVDQDDTFLDVIERLGRQRMVEVVRASKNEDALEKAYIHALDAALLNVPENGPESAFRLARDLRGLPGYDNLPLAFISASSTVQERVESVHAGASLFLDKPLQSEDLEAAVQYLVAIRQGGRPRVLIVDDDADFCELICLTLSNEGLLVRSANGPAKLLDVMQEFPPELMLLDVNMPGTSGFEVCKMLRGIPRWQDLPILFLTAQTGIKIRVAAFEAGGDDYLPKPFVNEELLARVKIRLDRARLMKERSDRDTVTGLLLRRAFAEQLAGVLAEAQRNQSLFTVCLIDVDHFKNVNDTHGHLAGDQVLGKLGQLLMRRFRVDDLRGRWGGEEFILAFRKENKQTTQAAVERFLEEFKQIPFKNDKGKVFHCSFSGGVASFPQDGESIFDLVRKADERLYIAKQAGRSRVYSDG